MNSPISESISWNEAPAVGIADKSATYTACMLASISMKRVILPHVLVGILKGNNPIGDWEPYLGVFFGECPAKILRGVADENSLTLRDLEKCYQRLPTFYQTPHFREICQDVV